ncbi:hypothetical protein [Streptomyces sp. NPDC050264]|uniref:hypothetical protein n=1 Tax=Streptomyces sp. NPDC050264 TaxID=3155038 RepID=UPI003421C909
MIREIEGYLMVEAARAEGRAAAERFAGRLPWLTESQAEEAQRAYVEEYVVLRRRGWGWCVARAGELRGEYERRYGVLRRRVCGVVCVVGALMWVGVAVIVAL